MHTDLSAQGRNIFTKFMLCGIYLILCSLGIGSSIAHAQDGGTSQLDELYTASTVTLSDGTILEKLIINGSPVPPNFEVDGQPGGLPQSGDTTPDAISLPGAAPAYVVSCASTSASDIAAMYDRSGYSNLFISNTSINGGIAPWDNSLLPSWEDVLHDSYSNNILTATHRFVDGRTTRGTIDDYWVSYDSTAPDPYITGGWTPHLRTQLLIICTPASPPTAM